MIDIESLYKIVEKSSNELAFNFEECKALYDLLLNLGSLDDVVEIGTQFGRSTTVIAEVQKELKYTFTTIDNWQEGNSADAKDHITKKAISYEWSVDFVEGDSLEVAKAFKRPISLILIDGDHHYDSVTNDCDAWLSKVKVGGHVCFDDYGHPTLPEVKKAVTDWMLRGKNSDNWEFVGSYGGKLGVFRRLS